MATGRLPTPTATSGSATGAYQNGSCGYQGSSRTRSTDRTITATADPARYQNQRESMYEYRSDGLAEGVYTVER